MRLLSNCQKVPHLSALCLKHRQNNPWFTSAAYSFHSGQQSHTAVPCQAQPACRQAQQAGQLASGCDVETPAKQYPRFYAPQLPVTIGSSIELEAEEAKHAVRVLRLKQQDQVELCDGRGGLTLCEVAHTDRSSATVVAVSEPQQVSWQGPRWILAAACLTLKGGRTEWLIEKATELGAYAVLPLITERSQTGTTKSKFKSLSSKASKGSNAASESGDEFNSGRLQRLALAATKQSLRPHALQLLPAQHLQDILPTLQQSPVSLVGTVGAPPVLHVLQQARQQQQQHQHTEPIDGIWQDQPCYLLVGPEGDFTAAEVEALADAGVLPVGLGSNRLRTETAALALLTAAVFAADAAMIEAAASADAAAPYSKIAAPSRLLC